MPLLSLVVLLREKDSGADILASLLIVRCIQFRDCGTIAQRSWLEDVCFMVSRYVIIKN